MRIHNQGMTTTATTKATILLGNAHSRGERIDAEYRRPGLYGIGGPGRDGIIVIATAIDRGVSARVDVRADGSFKVYPLGVKASEVREHRAYWEEILA